MVTLNEFRAMLGGISECTARKLINQYHVKHFYIRCTFYIPKQYVIDYLLSDHFMKYRFKLKHKIKWNETFLKSSAPYVDLTEDKG